MAMIINSNYLINHLFSCTFLSFRKQITRKNEDRTFFKYYQRLQSDTIVSTGSIGINTFYKNSTAFSGKHRNKFP